MPGISQEKEKTDTSAASQTEPGTFRNSCKERRGDTGLSHLNSLLLQHQGTWLRVGFGHGEKYRGRATHDFVAYPASEGINSVGSVHASWARGTRVRGMWMTSLDGVVVLISQQVTVGLSVSGQTRKRSPRLGLRPRFLLLELPELRLDRHGRPLCLWRIHVNVELLLDFLLPICSGRNTNTKPSVSYREKQGTGLGGQSGQALEHHPQDQTTGRPGSEPAVLGLTKLHA